MFFLLLFSKATQAGNQALIESLVRTGKEIRHHALLDTLITDWSHLYTAPRQNGSGQRIVRDAGSGSWLVSTGTWFFNGESGADAERKFLCRYLELGAADVVREVEGFFAIVIGDARTEEVVVITDIIGSCHTYWRRLKDGIAISDSSILLASLDDYSLDPVGCQEFLCTGVIYEDRTFYNEVKKLPPATIFRYSNGACRRRTCYWHISHLTPNNFCGKRAVEEVSDRIVTVVQNIARAYQNPVCDLTGGYDSRLLVAAFLAAGADFATTVSGPEHSQDVRVSKRIAERFHLPHFHTCHDFEPSLESLHAAHQLTDGELDVLEYARVRSTHDELSQKFDISLNGSFGEIARGYWWELPVLKSGAYRTLNVEKVAMLRFAASVYQAALFPPAQRLNLPCHFSDMIRRAISGMERYPNTMQLDQTYLSLRMQRWQGRIASSTNQIWPCLSPFMCRSVLEAMLQVEDSQRRFSRFTRCLLHHLQPELAALPLEHGYPATPISIKNFYRFWPFVSHMANRAVKRGLRIASSVLDWRMNGNSAFPEPVRVRLWREPELAEILQPHHMFASHLFDTNELSKFVENSKKRIFPYDGQWWRLLSLEMTMRKIHAVKHQYVSHARYFLSFGKSPFEHR